MARLKDEDSGDDELDLIEADNNFEGVPAANDTFDDDEVEEDEEDQTVAVSRRIAQGGQLVVVVCEGQHNSVIIFKWNEKCLPVQNPVRRDGR